MTYLIKQDESNASRRILYLWSVLSNGTSPAQFEAGGQPTISVGGLATWNSAGTLLSVNTTVGEYQVRLGASDVSLLGPGLLRYSSTSAVETGIPFMVVGYDPYGSLSTFNVSADSVGLKAVTHSGATIAGLVSTVSIRDGSYSAVTIGGVTRVNSNVTIAPATYSDVTVQVNGIAPGAYSGVTIAGVSSGVTLLAGRYSGTTIGGVEKLESAVTLAAGRYSDVTVGGVARVESAVTVDTGGIVAASFGVGAVDAVALATDAGQEIADRILQRNIHGGSDSGRTVSEALAALRNRVSVDGSAVTVYRENDTTAYWTASVATVSANSGIINSVDPA